MKVNLEKVYQCEHCGKKGRSAGSMSRHEKFCPQKPENKHICFEYCRHLKKDVETKWDESGEPYIWVTHFTCLAKHIKMYSYKYEKTIGIDPTHPYLKGLIRMPLDCDKFEVMTGHEQQDRFNE
jgi:hypothetical protein